MWEFLNDAAYRNLLILTMFVLIGGAGVYRYLEGWTWIDSVYFCMVMLTTVGFGDFAPKTDAGKIFTIFYLFVGVGIIFSFINVVYNHYSQRTPLTFPEKNDD